MTTLDCKTSDLSGVVCTKCSNVLPSPQTAVQSADNVVQVRIQPLENELMYYKLRCEAYESMNKSFHDAIISKLVDDAKIKPTVLLFKHIDGIIDALCDGRLSYYESSEKDFYFNLGLERLNEMVDVLINKLQNDNGEVISKDSLLELRETVYHHHFKNDEKEDETD